MRKTTPSILLTSFILGSLLTVGMMFYAFKYLVGLEQASFEQNTRNIVANIESNVEDARNELSGLTASLYAAKKIEADTLRLSTEHMFKQYHFFTTALFAPKVMQAQRKQFETEQREAGFINYTIHDKHGTQHEALFERLYSLPVYLIEPFDVEHVPLLGLDLLCHEQWANALQTAIKNAEDVALVASLRGKEFELWLFKALYSGYTGMSDPYFQENRQHMVNGVVAVALDLEQILMPEKMPEDMTVSFLVHGSQQAEPLHLSSPVVSKPAWWAGFMLTNQLDYMIKDLRIEIETEQAIYWFDARFLLFFFSGALGMGLTIVLTLSLREMVRSEERKRNVLAMASDAILSVDQQGNVLEVNPAVVKIFGQSAGQCVGEPIDALLELNDWDKTMYPSFMAFVEEHPELLEEVCEMKAGLKFGRDICVEVSMSRGQAGKEVMFTLFLRDVTEKKRLQKQSEHAQRLESLGVLAGGIAHDFNNLLTAIMGHASMAMKKVEPETKTRKHLQHVITASESAATLCQQMLAYSGKGAFVVKHLDLSETVEGVSQLLAATVNKSVAIEMRLSRELPKIEGDEGQVQQIVMNLIINASEALDDQQGRVQVHTSLVDLTPEDIEGLVESEGVTPGQYVKLTVLDTGCGMDKETLEKVFDPFFTTKFVGRGLGMSAILGIVRGHHGGLGVKSSIGYGTTFDVFFPVAHD